MCLINIKSKIPSVAKKQVNVYKVFYTDTYGSGNLESVFQGYLYKLNKEYASRLDVYNDVNLVGEFFGLKCDKGIHSFTSLSNASKYARWFEITFSNRTVIVARCILPIGTLYHRGHFDSSHFGKINSIASDKIIITEII